MPTPLICTTNTYGHTDYGIPVSAYKSTDYRTTARSYHRLIPAPPQDFVCRVKANIHESSRQSDPTIKDETYKTQYRVEYQVKQGDGNPSGYVPRPIPTENDNYIRIVQEKMFQDPPQPIAPKISEMKSSFYRKYQNYEYRNVFPPDPYATCEVKALGRDEQPPIRPENIGYYRYMDPYVTTTRITYIPFTKDQQDGIGRKDIITFYDAAGIPRGGKGYGPKNGPAVEPMYNTNTGDMYDKLVFKKKAYNKIIPKFMKRVPNFGMQSEYQRKYQLHTFSDFYPYLSTPQEVFDYPLYEAGPWQNLSPPGMYCTDYCHIGSDWPVRAVINAKKPVDYIERDVELCRNEVLNSESDVNIC